MGKSQKTNVEQNEYIVKWFLTCDTNYIKF